MPWNHNTNQLPFYPAADFVQDSGCGGQGYGSPGMLRLDKETEESERERERKRDRDRERERQRERGGKEGGREIDNTRGREGGRERERERDRKTMNTNQVSWNVCTYFVTFLRSAASMSMPGPLSGTAAHLLACRTSHVCEFRFSGKQSPWAPGRGRKPELTWGAGRVVGRTCQNLYICSGRLRDMDSD